MTILADLAAELSIDPELLRSTLLEGSEAETLTPNYLTTNPDGTVSATFTGHVKASGVDLQGGQAATNAIDWLRNSDGSLIASINGYDTADGTGLPKTGNLSLLVTGDATGSAGASVRATKGTGAALRAMVLSLDALENGLLVSSNVGLAAQKLLKIWDGNVGSDFCFSPQSVTQPARVLGTNYQPSSGATPRPTIVTASIGTSGAGVATGVEILIGANNPAATHVCYAQGAVNNDFRPVTFIVPPGWWYRIAIANGAPTIDKVTEIYL